MKASIAFLAVILLFTGFVQPGPMVHLQARYKGKIVHDEYFDNNVWVSPVIDFPIVIQKCDSLSISIGSPTKFSPLQNWK